MAKKRAFKGYPLPPVKKAVLEILLGKVMSTLPKCSLFQQDIMNISPNLSNLMKANVHIGHHVRRTHPNMKGCLKGQRNGTAIIDLDQTVQGLRQGLKVMETIHQKKGNILFVAQNPDAQQIVQDLASRTGQFYMTKWVSGFLTNWSVQQEYMATFYQTLNEGTLSKGRQRRKIQQLRQNYAGVLDMHEKPSVIFLFHARGSANVIREANRANIPLVGVVDSDADPSLVDYPIPGNDDSISATALMASLIQVALLEGSHLS